MPPFDSSGNATALRRELSSLNTTRAQGHEHEVTYGDIPNVIYREDEHGSHGNFLAASYRAICSHPHWKKRLRKRYTGGRWIARSGERKRCELDCSNSSDALLMNIFCYPRVLRRRDLCAMLGVDTGLLPDFGFKPRVPLLNGKTDQTEIDMRLGNILFEAKLTETGFQTVPTQRVLRYRDLEQVFDVEELPRAGNQFHSYQLIRGVLAAEALESSFLLLCDSRRNDLAARWFEVVRAVRSCTLRTRLKILTWQDLIEFLPSVLQRFLEHKYGIHSARAFLLNGVINGTGLDAAIPPKNSRT